MPWRDLLDGRQGRRELEIVAERVVVVVLHEQLQRRELNVGNEESSNFI